MPYSWDDDHDFETAGAAGYSFHSARRSYDDVAVAKTASKVFYTYKSAFLTTEAVYPIIVGIDTTGSMQNWPRVFFEKLPLLYKEAVKYFPECEISFQAINDYYADGADVALQPAPFGKGPQLDEVIGKLYPVGGGGGQSMESYEMFAAYNAFLQAPNAVIKPIAIILGDEAPFETVPQEVCDFYGLHDHHARVGRTILEKLHLKSRQAEGQEKPGGVPSQVVFHKLHEVCDVFLVRKPYHGGDEKVEEKWKTWALMPDERILMIRDPNRVVDVILGILGILTGKVDEFEQELINRQNESQVKDVIDSLHTLKQSYHSGMDGSQRSMTHGLQDSSGKTKRLDLDEYKT